MSNKKESGTQAGGSQKEQTSNSLTTMNRLNKILEKMQSETDYDEDKFYRVLMILKPTEDDLNSLTDTELACLFITLGTLYYKCYINKK